MRASIAASARCCSSAGPRAAARPPTPTTAASASGRAPAPVALRRRLPPEHARVLVAQSPLARGRVRLRLHLLGLRADLAPRRAAHWARERGVLGVALVARPDAQARAVQRAAARAAAPEQHAGPRRLRLLHRLEAHGAALVVLERPPRDAAAAAGGARRERRLREEVGVLAAQLEQPRRGAGVDRRAVRGARAAGARGGRRRRTSRAPRALARCDRRSGRGCKSAPLSRSTRPSTQRTWAQPGSAEPQSQRCGSPSVSASVRPCSHSLKEQGPGCERRKMRPEGGAVAGGGARALDRAASRASRAFSRS